MPYINGHPMLVEIVGVAGSGKSTLRQSLREMNSSIDVVEPPKKFAYLFPLIKIYTTWFPLYLREYSKTRWFSGKELKIICYLETWLPYLRKCAIEQDMVVVLDPGAIFWLTALKRFGPEMTKDVKFRAWWEEMRKKWMSAIDILVWLDAPSELLYARVMQRDEWHEIMDLTKEESIHSFDVYREGYAELVEVFENRRKNHTLKFRTDLTPAVEIFNQVKAVLGSNLP